MVAIGWAPQYNGWPKSAKVRFNRCCTIIYRRTLPYPDWSFRAFVRSFGRTICSLWCVLSPCIVIWYSLECSILSYIRVHTEIIHKTSVSDVSRSSQSWFSKPFNNRSCSQLTFFFFFFLWNRCADKLAMSSRQSRGQILTRFRAVNALQARDGVRRSVCCLLVVPHFARLSRLGRGWLRPHSRSLPGKGTMLSFFINITVSISFVYAYE